MDVLSLVSTKSLFYQKKGGTFIGEHKRQKTFASDLKLLRARKGTNLKKYLKNCRCTNDEQEMALYINSKGAHDIPKCNTINMYEFRLPIYNKLSDHHRMDVQSRMSWFQPGKPRKSHLVQ